MKKCLLVIAFVIFISGCVVIETDNQAAHTVMLPRETTEPEIIVETSEPEVVAPATTEPPVTITIGAVGDVLASGENIAAAKTGNVYEFSGHFQEVRDRIQQQDYTIANLISPIAGSEYPYGGYPNYNAPTELGQALSDVGIDAVNTANRYSLDLGPRAIQTNLGNIKAIGLTPFGTATSQNEANQLTIANVKGIRIGLLAYTSVLNQTSPNQYAVSITDQTKIASDIAMLRGQGVDIICVSLYWGEEYADLPNGEQINLMTFLENQGVDIVLGAYPHVVQPLVMKDIVYNDSLKPMVQAYSLGNFYSAFLMNRTKTGLMLEIEITKQDSVTKISGLKYSLIYNHQTKRAGDLMDYKLINLDDIDRYYEDALYDEMDAEKTRVEELLNSLSQ